ERHPSAKTLAARFGEVWAEARAVAIEHRLLTVPDWPVQHVEQPAWVRAAAPALYFLPYRSPPPLDPPTIAVQYVPSLPPDSQAGLEHRLRAVHDQVIKLNYVVHHSGIGHHAQNWHAMQAASRIGQIAAVDCASRIAMLCGGTLAEGWASYV